MNAVEKFYSEENPGDEGTGVEMTIEGIRIFITKESGIKVFYLAEKNGPGYHGYNIKLWNEMKEGFIQWARQNKVSLE